ncbi:hypothetical protein [Clostridium tetani]|uniref:hypothetical protein n=1 Tax=Clostridium tetani TaxID=1513 RepID=UPI0038B2949B
MSLIKKIINFFKKDHCNTSKPFDFSLDDTLEYIDNLNYEIPKELNSNPIFNRTTKEEELKTNFLLKYSQEVKDYEDTFYSSNLKIHKIDDIDLRIKQYELSIELLKNFKEFCCSKSIGGKLYFEDMWEHCHNIKKPDFKFIDKLYEELDDLKNNKDFYINKNKEIKEINQFRKIVNKELINIISKNEGILQKDIYKKFKPYFKDTIQSTLYFMDKNKEIIREKFGNTYKLYIKK